MTLLDKVVKDVKDIGSVLCVFEFKRETYRY